MQDNISPEFLRELEGNERTLVELWEFFTSEETDYTPANAILRVGTTRFTFAEVEYQRRAVSRGDAKRYLGKQANTCNLTLDNTDFGLTDFFTNNDPDGMWVQLRIPSLSSPGESLVIFGGRCDGLEETDPIQLTIRQDGGAMDAQFPARKLSPICPLNGDFKGKACRGNKVLADHTTAYQDAEFCDGSFSSCSAYGNTENFQGYRFVPINGTFGYQTVTPSTNFLGRLFGRKKRRSVSAPWSSIPGVEQDTVVPEVAGLMQCVGVPLMHADTGAKIRYMQMLGRGEFDAVLTHRIKDKQYLPVPDNPQAATGKYGSQGQPSATLFPNGGKFSEIAWVAGEAIGSDPADANDSAPEVVCVARARKFGVPDARGEFSGDQAWTDCGPYMVREYLTAPEYGRLAPAQLDDVAVVEAARRTFEPVIDDTGFEQVILPSTFTGGVDFRSWAAASGFGAATIDKIWLLMSQGKALTGGYAQAVEAYYRYVNQNAAPTTISGLRKVRRRYSTNFRIDEESTLGDFLYDILLPSFNGSLIFSAQGKVQITVDGPAPHSYLTDDLAAGVEELTVEDVTPWHFKTNSLALLGAHETQPEVVKVMDWRHTSYAPAIPVVAENTGTLTLATSSAALTGGDDMHPDSATLTIGGTVSAGAVVKVTIDGVELSYTARLGDDSEAIAGLLAALVNGETRLRRFVRAVWIGGATIVLQSKIGILTLRHPTQFAHERGHELVQVAAAFGGTGRYDKKVRENSFRWPLRSRQTKYNKFSGTFRSVAHDWIAVPIERNVVAHQKQTRKINNLGLNLSATDTAHQAARLLKIVAGKHRVCNWFASLIASGAALLLDVGDVVVVTDPKQPGKVNCVPVRLEDVSIKANQDAAIIGRLYHTSIYDDRIRPIDAPIFLPAAQGTATNTDVPPPPPPPPDTGGGGLGICDQYKVMGIYDDRCDIAY